VSGLIERLCFVLFDVAVGAAVVAAYVNNNNNNNNNNNRLIRLLEIYKIDPLIINSLQQLMKKWTTTLQVKAKNNQIVIDPIRIQRGLYQGDSLSPSRFCLALNPLSRLNRTNCGFGMHFDNQKIQRLDRLIYMDDIKVHAATNNQLKNSYGSLKLFQEILKWYLGLKNAKP
jgi:hypothetical protein